MRCGLVALLLGVLVFPWATARADNVRIREADALASGNRPARPSAPLSAPPLALPHAVLPGTVLPGTEGTMADDAEAAALLQAAIDAAVEDRLAGIPRPRYIPATNLVGPRGLLVYTEPPGDGSFPFALAVGGFLQLRWLEFARGATEWTNSAGTTFPIQNLNVFSLNRYLLSFTGHVVDERLLYAFALFGTSNAGIQAGVVPIGMVGWKFSSAAILGGGVTIVPGTREWVDSSAWTVGVDRSMANTFFRPGYSPGVAALGALFDDRLHYQAGIWNAIDGGTTGVLRRGTSMAFAGNVWWEPLAPFGLGFGDMEHHDDPAIRIGTSGVYARTYARLLPFNNPENTIVRLSDGTPLAAANALGPGTQLDAYRYHLSSIDAGWKWRGIGLGFEYYFRLLDDFSGEGTFARSSIFDHGGMGYVAWCFLPRRAEVYGRSSAVTGPFGTGQEYGGGLNWYVNGSRQGRFTVEALSILRSPTQAILYPYRAGATGTAIQTQFMVIF